MSTAVAYFWRKDYLDIVHGMPDFRQSSMLKYLYCPCVVFNENGRRWDGYYDQTENFKIGWMPGDIQSFEPEFRLALLLLGIS